MDARIAERLARRHAHDNTAPAVVGAICGLAVGLTLGAVAGREHLKYEMRQAVGRAVVETFPAAQVSMPKQPPVGPAGPPILTAAYLGRTRGDFGDSLRYRLTNAGGRTIASAKYTIAIYDQHGDRLVGLRHAADQPLAAGQSIDMEGHWPMVPDRAWALLADGRAEMQVEADRILYATGGD